MSIDINFYAGAVLQINKDKLIKTIEIPANIPQCCCKHKHMQKNNFCPTCGKCLIKATIENQITLDWDDLIEEFSDQEYGDEHLLYFPEDLSSNEYMMGIPNNDNGCCINDISNDGYNMELIINESFNYKKYIEQFNKVYNGFLKFLKNKNIQYDVKFMICTYYS